MATTNPSEMTVDELRAALAEAREAAGGSRDKADWASYLAIEAEMERRGVSTMTHEDHVAITVRTG